MVSLIDMAIKRFFLNDPPVQQTHGLLQLYRRGGGCSQMATLLSDDGMSASDHIRICFVILCCSRGRLDVKSLSD